MSTCSERPVHEKRIWVHPSISAALSCRSIPIQNIQENTFFFIKFVTKDGFQVLKQWILLMNTNKNNEGILIHYKIF